MRALDEKAILKRAFASLLPQQITQRKKQPYRAPGVRSFLDQSGRLAPLVRELLEPRAIAQGGYFSPERVARLVDRIDQGAHGGEMESMALIGIVTVQLMHRQFIEGFDASRASFALAGSESAAKQVAGRRSRVAA